MVVSQGEEKPAPVERPLLPTKSSTSGAQRDLNVCHFNNQENSAHFTCLIYLSLVEYLVAQRSLLSNIVNCIDSILLIATH